jgi:hypothetical protein
MKRTATFLFIVSAGSFTSQGWAKEVHLELKKPLSCEQVKKKVLGKGFSLECGTSETKRNSRYWSLDYGAPKGISTAIQSLEREPLVAQVTIQKSGDRF